MKGLRRPMPRGWLMSALIVLFVAAGLGLWWLQPSDRETPVASALLNAEEREWLNQHPVLRLAPDPNFPPIEYFDDRGKYRGLIADYYALIESRLGVRFEVVRASTWNQVLAMAKAREVDLIGAAQLTPPAVPT